MTIMTSKAENIMQGAEPFELKADTDLACLLIHGFGGSPAELKELAEFLNKKKITTKVVLLPGHGTDYHELEKVTWNDWYKHVEENYLELKNEYKTVYVIGFSTGGTLSLHLAKNYNIDKLVLINPFIYIKYQWYYIFPVEFYAKTLEKFIPFVTSSTIHINDYEARKKLVHYDTLSLKALNSTFELIELVKNELSYILSDTLIIQSRGDETVDPSGSEYIYNNLGSKEKQIRLFNKSNHIITLDYDKNDVFESIDNFLTP